ncbi:hypothetical protein AGMMS50256_09380 [Betaproteobacteria bacterium]|nr:hypothetical protein AGMMS50256_09380 [Betaproteobacteria bacterium]
MDNFGLFDDALRGFQSGCRHEIAQGASLYFSGALDDCMCIRLILASMRAVETVDMTNTSYAQNTANCR